MRLIRLSPERVKQLEAMHNRPLVRYGKGYISILCPIGHLIDSYTVDRNFAGSHFEAELGNLQTGQETRWHRLAASCKGHGHS
jgi:hypothetical protein